LSLEDLRPLWAPISPYPYIRQLRGTRRRILMFSGRYDPTFLPSLAQDTLAEFARHDVPYEHFWLPCGHYTMGELPFSAILGYRICRFMLECRDGLAMR